jgi:hypothetical protein
MSVRTPTASRKKSKAYNQQCDQENVCSFFYHDSSFVAKQHSAVNEAPFEKQICIDATASVALTSYGAPSCAIAGLAFSFELRSGSPHQNNLNPNC